MVLAETQEIMTGYVKKIAAATGTDGVGVIMNVREGADPKDKTIMRINFDTIYSWIVLDLTEPATITHARCWWTLSNGMGYL